MKKHKIIFTIIVLVLVLCLLGYTGYGFYVKKTYQPKDPIVTMNIDGYGAVKMELYPNMAPDTVRNFIKLINQGFYNGLTFHRVEADKLIQGGDQNGDGSGTNAQSVVGEFAANGYTREHFKVYNRNTGTCKARLFSVCFIRPYCNTKRL